MTSIPPPDGPAQDRSRPARIEATYRAILEGASDIIVVVDRDGAITYESPAAARILGYPPGSLLGRSPFDLVHPDDRQRIQNDLREVSENVNPNTPSSFRYRRADGTWAHLEAIGSNRLDDPDVAGLVICARDISERIRQEAALREAEERYRSLFDRSLDCVYLVGLDGRFIDANAAALALLGYRREEIPDLSFVDLLSPDQMAFAAERMAEIMQTGHQEKPSDFRLRSRDGREIVVETRACLVYRDGQPYAVLGIGRDVTAFQHLQAQLAQAQKMEAVGRLAGGVAHDFNNMLNVIIGHCDLALDAVPAADPLHAPLREIQSAAQRAADLTRQLLGFARRQTVTPKVLDLNDAVEGMLRMLRRLIGENIELAWRPGRPLWPVRIDPTQVDQILANLCVNARDAIGGVGRVTIDTANRTLSPADCAGRPGFAPGEYVCLTVADTGRGIEPAALGKIFEPFFTTKGVGHGTGLGLATVYGIVKQNHGLIAVESEVGAGATFEVFLPRHLPSA